MPKSQWKRKRHIQSRVKHEAKRAEKRRQRMRKTSQPKTAGWGRPGATTFGQLSFLSMLLSLFAGQAERKAPVYSKRRRAVTYESHK
jgi:hypothetical protein